MTSLPFLSICILNYNGRQYIERCLRSVMRSEYPVDRYEIIFVDNDSQDTSVDFVRNTFPSIKVVEHSQNYGFADGYNRIIPLCGGEYVIFLNNDTFVDHGWLQAFIRVAWRYPYNTIYGSKVLLEKGDHRLNSAGICITTIGSGYDRGFHAIDVSGQFPTGEVSGVSGAAMMIRKKYFQQLGMFDAGYFMYFEDVDLCLRAWLTGGRCVLVAESIVYHTVGGAAGMHWNKFRIFYGVRNRWKTFLKNFSIQIIITRTPLILVYDLCFNILSVLRGNTNAPVWTVLAYGSMLRQLPSILHERTIIQGKRQVSDRALLKKGVLVGFKAAFEEFLRLQRV